MGGAERRRGLFAQNTSGSSAPRLRSLGSQAESKAQKTQRAGGLEDVDSTVSTFLPLSSQARCGLDQGANSDKLLLKTQRRPGDYSPLLPPRKVGKYKAAVFLLKTRSKPNQTKTGPKGKNSLSMGVWVGDQMKV